MLDFENVKTLNVNRVESGSSTSVPSTVFPPRIGPNL